MTTRLVLFDLIVGGAIVVVLAVVAIGVVRTNLRPLDDIELTAGQIAAGHLYHRVPEGDPRTEVGSLGRSLNAMLAQIETAFGKQQQSERAAHESEERMRRFVADASHELRTPLTTIRGFAAHYRQRGGVSATAPAGTTTSSSPNGGWFPRHRRLLPRRRRALAGGRQPPHEPGRGRGDPDGPAGRGPAHAGPAGPAAAANQGPGGPAHAGRRRGAGRADRLPRTARSTWSSRRGPPSWWKGTSPGSGRCSPTWSTTR